MKMEIYLEYARLVIFFFIFSFLSYTVFSLSRPQVLLRGLLTCDKIVLLVMINFCVSVCVS